MTLANIDPALTEVGLYNLPGLTALPDMPAATCVMLENLPGVTVEDARKAAPNAKIWFDEERVQ